MSQQSYGREVCYDPHRDPDHSSDLNIHKYVNVPCIHLYLYIAYWFWTSQNNMGITSFSTILKRSTRVKV